MKHITLLLAAATAMAAAAAPAGPSLRIYKGESRSDTVTSSRYYLIAITEPGAHATINGEGCHVYNTGSFGAELTLEPGRNVIPVEARRDGRSTHVDVDIVYTPVEASAAPKAAAQPSTTPLEAPLRVVTREGAYLQHGDGGDRLGGSKMNFLPAGVPLTAIGRSGDRLYQVSLGQGGWAFVPCSSVDVDSTAVDAGLPTVNTGSISLANRGDNDRIVVSLPRRLPYYSRCFIDPSTIEITLYGAANNSNWLTQRNATAMVDYVDLRRDEADALTLVIRLKDKYSWGYAVDYEGNNLVIDVRHRPASLEVADLVIGLDAGHGGEYLGAVSPSGLTEKEVNLDIVLKAARMLRDMGAKVVLTRDGDTGPSMAERKKIWLGGGVDIAISVHNNASGNPLKPMGTSAYYKHISNRALAQSLHDSMLSLGLENFGLTGNFNFSLNAPTEYPNALVEVLFMSSLPEEELLADPAYRTQLARNIVKGLLDYLEQVKKSL